MKLAQIQILRALAALSVATAHAQHDASDMAGQLGRPFHAVEVLPWNAGVDMFFVISGLIMVHASRDLFGFPRASGIFFSRRIARIVPLYWAATTAYLAIALIAPKLLNSDILSSNFVLASYAFIPVARSDGLVQPLYGLGWTLNYEMLFYGLFAAAIGLPRRIAASLVLVVLATLVLVGRVLSPLPEPVAFWTNPIVLEFGFGIGLGLARAEGMRVPTVTAWFLTGAGLGLLALAAAFPETALTWPRPIVYGGPAALIAAAAALSERVLHGPVERWATAVGDASYALYLLHPFVIRGSREVFWRTGLAAAGGPWPFLAAALTLSVVAALLSFRLFERPLNRVTRRLLGADRGPGGPAPRNARPD